MGPSNTELNHTAPTMESEHGVESDDDLNTGPFIDLLGVQISTSVKKLSSSSSTSSSSPDSLLGNPFEDYAIELPESFLGIMGKPKDHENAQLAAKNGNNVFYKSTTPEFEHPIPNLQPEVTSVTPKYEQSNHELLLPKVEPSGTGDIPELSLNISSTTKSPRVQMMERSDESPYRIPSSVFVRTKSTNPMEWSVASNESLFSIHMGNMSFGKDPIFWRSGELTLPGEHLASGQQCFSPLTQHGELDFSPQLSLNNEATISRKNSDGSHVTEAAVKTMEEVPRKTAEDQSTQNLSLAISKSRHSDASTCSIQSFSFPILVGDSEKGASVRISGSLNILMDKPNSQPHSPVQQEKKIDAVKAQFEPYSPVQPEPKIPVATEEKAQTSWFSCFSCCRLCP